MELRWLIVAAAACSGAKPKAVEDAKHAVAARDAGGDVAAAGKGDVQIRVEWHDVPLAARASAGRTACGTPIAAAVAPTTTWGVPDAFVVVGVEHRDAPDDARITLDHCALVPRVVVAGGTIAIASAADAPAKLALTRRGDLRDPATLSAGAARSILLPIAGHEVRAKLDAGAIYELAGDQSAWIVAAPNAVVTDANGQATLRELPIGTYPVTAWLPPRAGQPARIAHGKVAVAAGGLAELVVELK